jgi:hypothetical protein
MEAAMTANPNWPAYNLRDAVNRLPAAARAKHAAVTALAEDQAALVATSMERGKGLDELIYSLETRLDRLDPKTEADTIKQLVEERDAAKVAFQTLTAQRDRRNAMKANVEQVLAQLQGFITALADGRIDTGGGIRPVKVDPVLRDGETLAGAIKRLRGDIARLNGESAGLQMAPLPPDEVKALIRAQVDKLAALGRPTLILDSGKVDISLPDETRFGDRIRLCAIRHRAGAGSGVRGSVSEFLNRPPPMRVRQGGTVPAQPGGFLISSLGRDVD